MSAMEECASSPRPQKSHERNEEEEALLLSAAATKKSKIDPASPMDDDTTDHHELSPDPSNYYFCDSLKHPIFDSMSPEDRRDCYYPFRQDFDFWSTLDRLNTEFSPYLQKIDVIIYNLKQMGWKGEICLDAFGGFRKALMLAKGDFVGRNAFKLIAYHALTIHYVEDGDYTLGCCDSQTSTPEVDIQYLKLMRKIIGLESDLWFKWNQDRKSIEDMLSDLPKMNLQCLAECIQDCISIFHHQDEVDRVKECCKYLVNQYAEIKWKENPSKFDTELRYKYGFLHSSGQMLDIVYYYWECKPEGYKSLVENVVRDAGRVAEEKFQRRLNYGYTRADYLKLKLEVAIKLELVSISDDDMNLTIPGHPDLRKVD